jgi:hypothetical protein
LLNRLAKDKSLRLLFVGFFLFFMVWQPSPAYAAQAIATITCQDSVGNTQSFATGWNNENNYFLDKGNIAQHFCEGGFAGQFTSFVSVVSNDGGELDNVLLYHPGYSPAPTPSPTPTPEDDSVDQTSDTTVRTEDASQDVARTEEVVREPEPVVSVAPVAPAPQPVQEPSPEPEPTPKPTPEPEPKPESPVKPVEAPKPVESPSPTPEPSVPSTPITEPQIPSEPVVEPEQEAVGVMIALEAVGKLVDNLRLIGSDMTPEVREQAQQVIVASVIVTQIALAGRKP